MFSTNSPFGEHILQKTHPPIAPDRRELSPQVTEGASGRCSSGFIMGRYLLVVIVTRLQLLGLFSKQPSASACQQGLTFLLRQESKQRSRLKGGITRSRSNCSPLENPPGGTIGRLTLRFGSGAGFQPLPPFWVVVFGSVSFPRCRLKARKSPASHHRTIPGFGGAVTICRRFPCEIGCGHCPPIPGGSGK